MAEEMRSHLEMEALANQRAGLSSDEARYAAHRQFGNIASIQEQAREVRRWVWLEALVQDVLHAARRLRRSPAFTVTALITLALCIGANTAIFTVVDALLLRPLPFSEPERLMVVINSYPGAGYPRGGPSIPNYFARREAITAFANVAMLNPVDEVIGEPGNLRKVMAGRVTPDFFRTLGVSLAKGSMFTDSELTYETAGVVVLTDEFWRSQFGADPEIVGKTLMTDGTPKRIIGVLPAGFRFLSSGAQYFKPLAFNPPERAPANLHNSLPGTIMVARLAPGATVAEAQSQLDALDAQQATIDPSGAFLKEWGYHSIALPLHEDYVREVRPILILLQGGVLLLLLIGAVNLTNLLLVRTSDRNRELAVRQALGASRSRLARESWLETTLIALGGGVFGLALGAAGVRLLLTLGANQLPLGPTIAFDSRIAATVLLAAIFLGGLLAIGPIFFVRRLPINAQLQVDFAGGLPSGAAHRVRQWFSTVQIALAFVLLGGAGLLGVSLHRALAQPVGFTPDHILTGNVGLPWKGYPTTWHQVIFARRLEYALSRLPGSTEVAISNGLPFSGYMSGGPVSVENRARDSSATVRAHNRVGVSANYWRAMGIPLLRGKLTEAEIYGRNAENVCVVDRAMADAYWPDSDPVGKRICFGTTFDPSHAVTVIGVVGTVKQTHTEDHPMGMIYSPFEQFPSGYFLVVLRSPLPSAVMAESLRKTVTELDPNLVVTHIASMEQMIDDTLLTRRSPAILAAIFAGVAVVLAAVGTYGVLACAVNQRRREIGVRMALGALPGQIGRRFLNLGLRLLAAGIILGVIATVLMAKAMQSVLYGVPAIHGPTLAATGAILAVISLCACWLPARRAARVDPIVALRAD